MFFGTNPSRCLIPKYQGEDENLRVLDKTGRLGTSGSLESGAWDEALLGVGETVR